MEKSHVRCVAAERQGRKRERWTIQEELVVLGFLVLSKRFFKKKKEKKETMVRVYTIPNSDAPHFVQISQNTSAGLGLKCGHPNRAHWDP